MVERVTGTRFYDLVVERVFGPAGLVATAFLRADELPARAARGYLSPEGLRTNVLHLPVRGSGDGGVYDHLDGGVEHQRRRLACRRFPRRGAPGVTAQHPDGGCSFQCLGTGARRRRPKGR